MPCLRAIHTAPELAQASRLPARDAFSLKKGFKTASIIDFRLSVKVLAGKGDYYP